MSGIIGQDIFIPLTLNHYIVILLLLRIMKHPCLIVVSKAVGKTKTGHAAGKCFGPAEVRHIVKDKVE